MQPGGGHPDVAGRKGAGQRQEGVELRAGHGNTCWHRSSGEHQAVGRSSILACSSLKRAYRNLLRTGAPRVRFLHLHGDQAVLQARLDARKGHFFPPDLLASQYATLEPLAPDEDGIVVDVDQTVEAQVEVAIRELGIWPR